MSTQDASRPTAVEVFEDVLTSAREELRRTTTELGFSGLAAGLAMGLTGLAVAAGLAAGMSHAAALTLYPVGFVAVVIGRQQLFTENTLYPVALTLDEPRREHVLGTARLWVTVLAANVAGAVLFAALAARTGALPTDVETELVRLGTATVDRPLDDVFWSAIVGGWLIALVAWLVTAAQWTSGHVAVVWLLTFVVGIGGFAHCIASSGEILAGVWEGDVSVGDYVAWLAVATVGNVVGGVSIVTVLNYGQVSSSR
jgi:formate/nitrite transporter FocA (FNT family)